MMYTNYVEWTERFVKLLQKANALHEFRGLMLSRAEMTARNQTACNDDALMQALRGQLTICFELADSVLAALESEKALAGADEDEGHPNGGL